MGKIKKEDMMKNKYNYIGLRKKRDREIRKLRNAVTPGIFFIDGGIYTDNGDWRVIGSTNGGYTVLENHLTHEINYIYGYDG